MHPLSEVLAQIIQDIATALGLPAVEERSNTLPYGVSPLAGNSDRAAWDDCQQQRDFRSILNWTEEQIARAFMAPNSVIQGDRALEAQRLRDRVLTALRNLERHPAPMFIESASILEDGQTGFLFLATRSIHRGEFVTRNDVAIISEVPPSAERIMLPFQGMVHERNDRVTIPRHVEQAATDCTSQGRITDFRMGHFIVERPFDFNSLPQPTEEEIQRYRDRFQQNRLTLGGEKRSPRCYLCSYYAGKTDSGIACTAANYPSNDEAAESCEDYNPEKPKAKEVRRVAPNPVTGESRIESYGANDNEIEVTTFSDRACGRRVFYNRATGERRVEDE